MLCFVVVMQSFIMNSHEVFIHIHQGCFAGTGTIVRLPQCQWSKPDGYGKISQWLTTTKHSKAKNRVHIHWAILYICLLDWWFLTHWPLGNMAVISDVYISNRVWGLLSLIFKEIKHYPLSLNGRTSHRKISQSLEVARFDVIMILSPSNLTGISAALLPRWLSNFRTTGNV